MRNSCCHRHGVDVCLASSQVSSQNHQIVTKLKDKRQLAAWKSKVELCSSDCDIEGQELYFKTPTYIYPAIA